MRACLKPEVYSRQLFGNRGRAEAGFFLKNSICSDSWAIVRRTFDHNIWEP